MERPLQNQFHIVRVAFEEAARFRGRQIFDPIIDEIDPQLIGAAKEKPSEGQCEQECERQSKKETYS
jgi:hypothetical protein